MACFRGIVALALASAPQQLSANPEDAPPPTLAPQQGPSEDLSRLASDVLASSPAIAAQRAEVEVRRARLTGARAGYLPQVSANASIQRRRIEVDNQQLGDASFTPKEVDLTGRLPLFDGFKTRSSVRVGKNELESGVASLELVINDTLLDLVGAYADVRRDRRVSDYAEQQYDAVAKQLVGTSRRLDLGEATKTDANQATARLTTSTAGLYAAVENVIASESAFTDVVGRQPGMLPDPPPLPPPPATLDEARSIAMQSSPALRAAEFNARAAADAIDVAKAALYPNLDAVAGAEYLSGGVANLFTGRLPNDRGGFFGGLQLRMPIYLPRENAEVRRAQEVHRQRLAQIGQVERATLREVDTAWARWKTATATAGSAREGVAAYEAAAAGVEKEAAGGSRTVLDVLDAQDELLEARKLLERALREELVAHARLLAAVGRLDDAFGAAAAAAAR